MVRYNGEQRQPVKNNHAMNVQSKIGTIGRDEGHEGEDSTQMGT